MTDELKLICLVAGEPASNAFSVKASSALIVDELKGLIKVKKAPEFDDFAADKITLWRASIHVNPANKHKPIVLDDIESKTELDPTDNISDVFDESPPKKTIQIIVQRPLPGLLSEFDFVRGVPSAIVGQQQDRGPGVSSSHGSISVTPSSFQSWEGFLNSVRIMDLDRTPRYQPPRFKEDRTFRPEAMLHELFSQDVGSVRALPPFANTTKTMRLPHGVPDLVCLRAGSDLSKPESVLFPIEIKRPALLRSENLIVDLMTQEQSGMARGSARALNQTFGYMRLNGYRYGVLSTYEQTWFLQREGQGTNDLVVSPTIAFDRTEPSLLQCYLWFVRQANADVRDLDPPSDSDVEMLLADENRPGDKRAQDNSQYRSKKSRFKDSISSLFSSRKTRSGSNVTAQMVVPAFVSMQLISHDEGAQTYKASWQGCDVIVKKCDIWNERPVKEELKHEAEVYQILRNLQGRYIPKLRITGIADGMEMILVTDYVGTDISQERLDASDQEKIRAALYAIHDLGVVHGDIQPHNILVQREGRSFYFVDFGLSQINPDMAQRQRETALLGSLLRRMAA